MRIVIVHGYFLQGTGSNLFVSNLSRELCLMGHEVLLFSQENKPEKLDFVTKSLEFSSDNCDIITRFERNSLYPGKCLCFRPNLGGKLPVYVYDNYEGYQVKTFSELTRPEIEDYIEKNQKALCTALSDRKPDLILSNHIIMQPVYVNRARSILNYNIPHFNTVHGSCVNFAVRKSQMIKEYAQEALAEVDQLVFMSDFSCKEFIEFFDNHIYITGKVKVIPAGVDVNRFRPLALGEEKVNRMKLAVEYLRQNGIVRVPVYTAPLTDETLNLRQEGREMWLPDRNAAERIQAIEWSKSKLILYYGKYLWTKGIHLLLAALPLVLERHSNAYCVLVGFGEFRTYLETMIAALHQGQEDTFREMLREVEEISSIEGEGSIYFRLLLEKLDDPVFAKEYFNAAKGEIGHKVIFTGFLPHEYLCDMIPCADITVAASIFPEAFGMVAVEALASGVIPLQTNHSGFSEVIARYTVPLKGFFQGCELRPLFLDENLIFNLASNMNQFLDYYEHADFQKRHEIRECAREIALGYSWISMIDQYLNLYKAVIPLSLNKEELP